MCGVVGIISKSSVDEVSLRLKDAALAQRHRGPDCQSDAVYDVDSWNVGFSHQRLSVIDLSAAGNQPMSSQSSESSIIYNGEVYNYKEIKEGLGLSHYASKTDTEVVIQALEELGIEAAVNSFNGMWAFAWLNRKTKKLYLCRDRLGIKPLYYYMDDDSLYFSSEVKSIVKASQDKFELNLQAVGEYLNQSTQDTENNSFFSEIKAVPAAHFIEIDLAKTAISIVATKYWDVSDAQPYSGNNLTKDVHDLFHDAVRLRMRSDVPIGVTLSGGLDSSAIAQCMKEHLGVGATLNILSAVSPGSKLDESEFIGYMEEHLCTEVSRVSLKWEADEALDLLKQVTWHNDSPAGSFSNVAHYLLMKKANELGVTVILSGQGADELLCGYKKYLGFYIQSLLRKKQWITATKVLFDFVCNRTMINQFSFSEAKRYLPKFLHKSDINILGSKVQNVYVPKQLGLKSGQSMESRQIEDLRSFSVPFLTHYEDRMSMAWSREIRLPFLDYRLVELLINLPTKVKLDRGWSKYIFRKAMDGKLPDSITWRKDKQGFVSPQEEWLRNELRPDVIKLFNKDALIFSLGLIDRDALLKKYELYCRKGRSAGNIWYRDIFAPLALEIWLQINKSHIIEQ